MLHIFGLSDHPLNDINIKLTKSYSPILNKIRTMLKI